MKNRIEREKPESFAAVERERERERASPYLMWNLPTQLNTIYSL